MGYPWIFFFLLAVLVTGSNGDFQLTPNPKVIEKSDTEQDGTWVLYMKENNHVPGSNTSLLFTISGVTDVSFSWLDPTATFKFTASPKGDSTERFEIAANQYFDYETQPNRYGFLCGTNAVILNIINYDDEQPTLSSPMCTFSENQMYTTENTTCNCTLGDADGWLSKTTFTVINSDKGAESDIFNFEIDKSLSDKVYETTVYITLKEKLDYDKASFYSFNVQAKDSALHTTKPNADVRTIIYVNDTNTKPPIWESYASTSQFKEKTKQIFEVKAVDGNKGRGKSINYTVIDKNPEQCVMIDAHSGNITVSPIDRDARDILTYPFQLIATLEDDPVRQTPINVTYYIDDIDDNAPLVVEIKDSEGIINETYTNPNIKDKEATFKILENYNQSLNLIINITDRDTGANAQFTVALENYDTSEGAEDYTSAFYVVPDAGYKTGEFRINVKNVTKLDYEVPEWDHIKFYVHSKGVLNKTLEDKLLINISLIDYNDEWPKFKDSEYSISINETLGKDEFITQVEATDRDAADKILTHELVCPSSIADLLRIDPDTGKIFVNKENAFDFDKINPIIVQVKAVDKVKHTATVPLTINLLDVNNKAPTIAVNGTIRVEEKQHYGAVLNTRIIASDVDTTRNLTAEISWDDSYAMKNSEQLNTSNPDIVKLIRFLDLKYKTDPSSGSITINLVVNEETKVIPAPNFLTFDTLYLSIVVTDLNTDPAFIKCCMKTKALITINIINLHDNPPIFTNETIAANRTAYEKADKGIIVGTIKATDADVGDIVTYSCSCIDKYNRDWFVVNKINGEMTVKSDKAVNADDYPLAKQLYVEYNCSATDGKFITPHTFAIYIIDKNNQVPQFSDTFENITIDEQSPKDALVTKINTTDHDRDLPFHTVQCSFNNPNEACFNSFRIDPEQNNAILVKVGGNDLNRDTGAKNYSCSVRCLDNPNQDRNEVQLYSDTKFWIILNDINNNAPELIDKEKSGSENLKENEVIAVVTARDIDSGVNSQIDFGILEVYKDYKKIENDLFDFKINETIYFFNDTIKLLTLVAKKDLKDNYGEYSIKIKMTDRGVPQQSAEAMLPVKIEKFNFFDPTFIFPQTKTNTLVLNLDQKIYSQLTLHLNNEMVPDLRISDHNDESCSGKWDTKFDFKQIEPSSGNSIFTINSSSSGDSCSGQLQVNNYYDKEQAKKYVYKLSITAVLKEGTPDESQGEKPFSVTQELTISFFDVNQEPVFNKSAGSWKFIMAEDDESLVEKLPKELQAYYINIPEGYSKYYFLDSNNQSVIDTFKVDVNTGTIGLKKSLTFLEIQSYSFQIVASKDTTKPTSSKSDSMLDVFVMVNETNRNTPQWKQDHFFGSIMSTYPKDYKILTANASDLDLIDQGKLTYRRTSAIERFGSDNIFNVNDPAFKYDEKTGDITLNFAVDNSMSGYFWFDIGVEDVQDWKGNGPHSNNATVTIYIVSKDKNTVSFRFGNTLDSVLHAQNEVLKLISKGLGSQCYSAVIDHDSQDGQDLSNQTLANIYCIEENAPITSDDILKRLANVNTFQNLRSTLMNNCSVWLLAFTTDSNPENLEETLKAVLIGVSVLLGACCVILSITFFLKTRELNRRLKKLTEPKFGSDESDLNRKGINGMHAPNTNVHAVEGSNPVFNINGMKDVDFGYDKSSIHSGDSDLIGIEDRPEFDIFDNVEKERF